MAADLRRKTQISVRLNENENRDLEELIGYRGLWEISDLVRAGLQLLIEAEQDDFAARGTTGALKRRNEVKRGTKK